MLPMTSPRSDDFVCPNCGADFHPNARTCKCCGTSPGSPSAAWRQSEHLDGVNLPANPGNDPTFDYDEFISREFGDENSEQPIVVDLRKVIWWLTAVILLIVFAVWTTRSR